MSGDRIVNDHVSVWQRAILIGIVAAFAVLGTLRLNDCDLFNPDSPRYVIYSQAIVDLGEYRATDVPGAPLYTWRPPGLSLLIAPMMALRPYDVVAAKAVVLFFAAILLWVTFEFARFHSGARSALLATIALASGPTFLVLSTEVLSEIPYTLCVLTVLLILCRSTMTSSEPEGISGAQPATLWNSTQGWSVLLATAVMAFTPWLRTAGVSLVLAVGLWSLLSRKQLKWLIVASSGVAGVGMLAWRNQLAGGENYAGSLFSRLRDKGLGTVLMSGVETITYYLSMLPGLLLPGLTNERAWYAPLALDGVPKLGLPSNLAALMASILVLLALLGMYRRLSYGGSLALIYVVIYGGCLVVWPWRHERFLWPLFPVFWAFVPAGFSAITRDSGLGRRIVLGVLPIVGLCTLQIVACEKLVQVNQEFLKDRDAFHEKQLPGFYFSDWRMAGEWLNANTPPYARVLTWHAAVGETSHRFQKRVPFETLSPEKIRQQIDQFSARYLVAPEANFGDGFGWQQLEADPAIRLKIVFRKHDVVILEVEPNRTGVISKLAYHEWINERLSRAEEAARRLPGRTDIAIRNASLKNDAGETDDAIKRLREVVAQGTRNVRVFADLGWMLFDSGNYDDAVRFLDQARRLPNAESISHQLTDGISRALERVREKSAPNSRVAIERSLSRIKSMMGSLKYADAEKEMNRLMTVASDNPDVVTIRGVLHHRLGEISEARDCYERAIHLGSKDAEPWLFLIRMDEVFAAGTTSRIEAGRIIETIDPQTAAGHLRWATAMRERGWPGRALATLENAMERFPNEPTLQAGLADLYRQFARPDLAKPLYEAVLAASPHDKAAADGLKTAESCLMEPATSPRGKNHPSAANAVAVE